MSEPRIPQGGLRKPRSKYPISSATSMRQHIDRMKDGRYRVWNSKENRCCRPVQIGVALICVVDDFGALQVVEQEGYPWH